MKNITFTEFRKNASLLISEVETGEIIHLIRHGRPVAKICSIPDDEIKILSWKKPRLKLTSKGEGLSAAILKEREAL